MEPQNAVAGSSRSASMDGDTGYHDQEERTGNALGARSDVESDAVEEDDPEMAYERERQRTIKKNEALLLSLGLGTTSLASSKPKPAPSALPKPSSTYTPQKKKKKSLEPPPEWTRRRSGRIAVKIEAADDAAVKEEKEESSGLVAGLPDDWDDRKMGKSGPRMRPGEAIDIPSSNKRRRVDFENLTNGHAGAKVDYGTKQPLPGRMKDGTGRLVFEGQWEGVFEPNVTPEEMFKGGAFGGSFYCDNYSKVLKAPLPAYLSLPSLPPSLLQTVTPPPGSTLRPYSAITHLTATTRDRSINRFGVAAGQSLQDWEKSGWIWEGDPRGWAEWYMRFYQGRRCADDERQVQRWLNLAGPSGRFSRALLKKIANETGAGGLSPNNTAVSDESVATVMRQVCWQWGWEVNREEWKRRISPS